MTCIDHYVALLWDAVSRADRHAATEAVTAALRDGVAAETVLLEVIGTVQARVGVEWAADRMSVAREHAATAINERVIGTVAERPIGTAAERLIGTAAERLIGTAAPGDGRGAGGRGRIIVACVDGEWHALPARLLTEVLRLRGFDVDHLGARVPVAQLIAHLHRTGPDAVALSSSLAVRLPAAHATISACQAGGVPVLVGGAAFGADGRYARLLGADAWAPDARSGADTLAVGLPRPVYPYARPADELPAVSDHEFGLVSRTAPALAASVLDRLAEQDPQAADDDTQMLRTAEDVRHIIDFLAAALYLGDASVLTDFLDWAASVRAARSAPAHVLASALDLLAAELRECPRAAHLLASRSAVDAVRAA